MLTPFEIDLVDRQRISRVYEEWPTHVEKALQIEVHTPEAEEFGNIIFGGMGGSAAAGDILYDWLSPSIKVPFTVVKDYHLPGYVNSKTLVLAVSCSGDTEEAISILYEALKKDAKIAAVSAGGRLEAVSRSKSIPHTKVRKILVPRASFPYLFYVSTRILEAVGCISSIEKEVDDSIAALKAVCSRIRRSEPEDRNISKQIALELKGTYPTIYASNLMKGVAFRFKSALNENAKMHASINILPELCHNEVVGWEKGAFDAERPLFLRYNDEPEEVRERFEAVREIIEASGKDVIQVNVEGRSRLSKIVSALYILDFTSIYLAILRSIDPVPTPSIDLLKERLATRLNYLAKYTESGAD